MQLSRDNKPLASIYLPESACEIELFAAKELQRYLKIISGASFSILRKEPKQNAFIYMMTKNESADKQFEHEEFIIETNQNCLLLAAGSPRALLYAAYEFLEILGCRWFYPNKQEEVIPSLNTLEVESLSVRKSPTLAYRGLFPSPFNGENLSLLLQLLDWMAKNKMNLLLTSPFDYEDPDTHGICDNLKWSQVKKSLLPEIRKRGIMMNMGEHNVEELFPAKLFHEHPEWFALVGHTRVPRQICYSNSEAVDYYTKSLLQYIIQNPQEADIVGTWPRDGGNYCECEGCKKKDVILKAVNRVAIEVKKVSPDMIVEYLAYTPQTYEVIPDTLPEKNVSVLVCKRNKMKSWIQHSAKANAQGAHLFEYKWSDNYNQQGKIILRAGDVTSNTSKMAKLGAKGIVVLLIPPHNWWASGFNNYFFAKTAWAKKHELDLWLSDYVNSYYSEAAQPMMKFFNILREQEDFLMSKNTTWGCVNKDEWSNFSKAVQSGRRTLKQAQSLAVKDEIRLRVKRCSLYIEFYNIWITAQYYRQLANDTHAVDGVLAKRFVFGYMKKVERLENDMIAMTRADDPRVGGNGDGVLESELFRIRRTGRLEQDQKLKNKVSI
jgi:hypothetical protein